MNPPCASCRLQRLLPPAPPPALQVFVLDLDPSITPAVYERVNACVREFS